MVCVCLTNFTPQQSCPYRGDDTYTFGDAIYGGRVCDSLQSNPYVHANMCDAVSVNSLLPF